MYSDGIISARRDGILQMTAPISRGAVKGAQDVDTSIGDSKAVTT